ncbi:MAG: ubiquitin-conjugating enzyme E2 [Promethearchaeota archaeon]
MLEREEWLNRIVIDGFELKKEEPTFHTVDGDYKLWEGVILGGRGIYEGGIFRIRMKITRKYPFEPPVVSWETPIWHPNIFNKKVCLGILGDDWAPANNFVAIVESLRFLLSHPNPYDYLNSLAAQQYLNDFSRFVRKAKEWVNRYASSWHQARTFQNPV